MSEKNNSGEVFSYTYSARQQEEVRRIRERYAKKEEDKMEQLRRLDAGAAKKGTVVSLGVGLVSTLVFGAGMSLCLTRPEALLLPGIVTGVIGLIGAAAAYPLYAQITKIERARVAPQILELTEELLK